MKSSLSTSALHRCGAILLLSIACTYSVATDWSGYAIPENSYPPIKRLANPYAHLTDLFGKVAESKNDFANPFFSKTNWKNVKTNRNWLTFYRKNVKTNWNRTTFDWKNDKTNWNWSTFDRKTIKTNWNWLTFYRKNVKTNWNRTTSDWKNAKTNWNWSTYDRKNIKTNWNWLTFYRNWIKTNWNQKKWDPKPDHRRAKVRIRGRPRPRSDPQNPLRG